MDAHGGRLFVHPLFLAQLEKPAKRAGGTNERVPGQAQKIIIHAWVNDEGSLPKSGSKTDAYSVFKAMLKTGEPPTSFTEILRASKEMAAQADSPPGPKGKRK
jgi:hypothetical protein